ncbi:hypothetical protein [Dyella monticola]|nr:hypothetical protein [Dyella monticola]
MATDRDKRSSFNPKGLAEFLLLCGVLGILISLHARAIDYAFTLLWLAFLVIGSVVILWRMWKHPDEFKRRGMGQSAVLPRRWRKWLHDEDDKDSSR